MGIESNTLMPRAELLLNMLDDRNRELTVQGVEELFVLFKQRAAETGAEDTPAGFMLYVAGISDGAKLMVEGFEGETMRWHEAAWNADKIHGLALIIHDAKGETHVPG